MLVWRDHLSKSSLNHKLKWRFAERVLDLLRFGLKIVYFLKISIITLNRCQWRDSFALKSMWEIYIDTFRNYIDPRGRAKHLRGWWAETPLAIALHWWVAIAGDVPPTHTYTATHQWCFIPQSKRCLGPPAAKMLRPTSPIDVVSKSVDV